MSKRHPKKIDFASYIKAIKSIELLYAKSTKYSESWKDRITTHVIAFNRDSLVLLNIYIPDNTDFILHDKNPLCHYLIFF